MEIGKLKIVTNKWCKYALLFAGLIAFVPSVFALDRAAAAKDMYDKGWEISQAGYPVEALPFYEVASLLEPGEPVIWSEYCALLRKTNHLQQALISCLKSIHLDQKSTNVSEAWRSLTNVLIRAKEWKHVYQGVAKIREAGEEPEWLGSLLTNIGYYAWLDGENTLAAKAFKDALSINPNNMNARIDLGMLQLSIGESAKGRNTIKKAMKGASDEVMAYASAVLAEYDAKGKLSLPYLEQSYENISSNLLHFNPQVDPLSIKLLHDVEKYYPIKGLGTLSVTIPAEWHEVIENQSENNSLSYNFTARLYPNDASRHKVLISVIPAPQSGKDNSETLDALMDMSIERYAKIATKLPLKIKTINNESAKGKYIFTKDKNLLNAEQNDKDYLYSYQAMILSQDNLIIVTALAWDHSPEFQNALQRLFSTIQISP